MLRITEYIRDTIERKEIFKRHEGVILIWNITNACNLYCRHCYSSANQDKVNDATKDDLIKISEKLPHFGVKFVIISGGEPLLREEVFILSKILRQKGIRTYLSTNGIMVAQYIKEIKENFDYVGISIDGEPEIHDFFRGKKGAFSESIRSIRECSKEGIRVGLRFSLTQLNERSLKFIFDLVEKERIPKLYISHLVFSGRGKKDHAIHKEKYKNIMEFVIQKSFEYVEKGERIDIVTGNNEADAVVLFEEFKKRYPQLANNLYERLLLWGGNQAGVRLMNIDHRGNVKPDPFFFHSIGNAKDDKTIDIWNSGDNELLKILRQKPRKIKGKCMFCPYIDICNGSSRARAFAVYKNYEAEDPSCYI